MSSRPGAMGSELTGGPLRVELAGEDGRALVIEWDREALDALRTNPEASPAWRIVEGSPPQPGALRVISAAFDDGSALALAGVRAPDAPGHDQDVVSGVLVDPDGGQESLTEALISTRGPPSNSSVVAVDGKQLRDACDADAKLIGLMKRFAILMAERLNAARRAALPSSTTARAEVGRGRVAPRPLFAKDAIGDPEPRP